MSGTMFYKKPKHPSIAKIVSLESPTKARKAANKLLSMFKGTKRRDRKVAIKRAAVLAANRAGAAAKRRNLSAKERKQFGEIEKIYRNVSKRMVI